MEYARLTAAETAARLGVKPETLYAYVSRGLLSRERGRAGSSFDPLEVERFAADRRRGPGRSPVLLKDGRPAGGPLMTIDTDVALIEDDELYYRGRSATGLARTTSFESVCRWLWGGRLETETVFRPLPGVTERVTAVLGALPPDTPRTDRIRIAVQVIAGADPLRDDLDPSSVAHRSGAMIIALAAALHLPDRGSNRAQDQHGDQAARTVSTAEHLAVALERDIASPEPRSVDHDRIVLLVNAALVLLVDHDLAVSTLAARAAASARANPYAVVTSGLGALDSALHGNVSRSAYRMVAEVLAGQPARDVIARTIADGATGVPGFGHRIYSEVDPRAKLIFELLADHPAARPVLDVVDEVEAVMSVQGGGFANVDLGLAALALATGMADDAGEVIFAIARIGGWIAHAIDEYGQPPLRLRPVGRYIGP